MKQWKYRNDNIVPAFKETFCETEKKTINNDYPNAKHVLFDELLEGNGWVLFISVVPTQCCGHSTCHAQILESCLWHPSLSLGDCCLPHSQEDHPWPVVGSYAFQIMCVPVV